MATSGRAGFISKRQLSAIWCLVLTLSWGCGGQAASDGAGTAGTGSATAPVAGSGGASQSGTDGELGGKSGTAPGIGGMRCDPAVSVTGMGFEQFDGATARGSSVNGDFICPPIYDSSVVVDGAFTLTLSSLGLGLSVYLDMDAQDTFAVTGPTLRAGAGTRTSQGLTIVPSDFDVVRDVRVEALSLPASATGNAPHAAVCPTDVLGDSCAFFEGPAVQQGTFGVNAQATYHAKTFWVWLGSSKQGPSAGDLFAVFAPTPPRCHPELCSITIDDLDVFEGGTAGSGGAAQ